jgi:hypothetical protein
MAPAVKTAPKGFDKKAWMREYMREYMRARRAQAKAAEKKRKRKPGVTFMLDDVPGSVLGGRITKAEAEAVYGKKAVAQALEMAARVANEEEPGEKQDLPPAARIRGFIYRAEEAIRDAEQDDLIGLKITKKMAALAKKAAKAWTTLAEKTAQP